MDVSRRKKEGFWGGGGLQTAATFAVLPRTFDRVNACELNLLNPDWSTAITLPETIQW